MEQYALYHRFSHDIKSQLEYPAVTLWEAVKNTACNYPDNTALIYMNRRVTYNEMIKRIYDVQRGFEMLGVKQGDKVIICLPNTLQAVYALYALNRLGAVACFVHPLSAARELQEYARITGAKFFVILKNREEAFMQCDFVKGKKVVVTSLCDEVAGFSLRLSRNSKNIGYDRYLWRELMRSGEASHFACAQVSCSEPAVVLFSGGTTGKPKGVLISSFALNAMATGTKQMSGCEIEGKTMLSVTPLFHGFGLGVCIHTPLMFGGCAVLVSRFLSEKCGKIIKKYRPSFIAGVPAMYEALTKSKSLRKADLSFLAGVFSGGDTLQAKLKSKLDGYLEERGAKVRVREGYGLTESIAVSCLTPCNRDKKGSVGVPLPDMCFRICREGTVTSLPRGKVGEICITGPSLMLSYLGDEKETQKVMRLHPDGRVWLHTGDAGLMDEEGFVYFKGRLKRMIVTNGYNVYPASVEEVLYEHPAVRLCCVVGVKDPCKTEKVKAFVVLFKGFDAKELKKSLVSHCRCNLARFAVPSEIEIVKELPLTKLGKVDYRKLEGVSEVDA